MKLIETYQLQDYTLIALGKKERNYTEEWTAAKPAEEPVAAPVVVKAVPVADQSVATPIVKESPPPSPLYPEGIFSIHNTRVLFAKKRYAATCHRQCQQYFIKAAAGDK